jgi:Xaa-Pro aminopeptidase
MAETVAELLDRYKSIDRVAIENSVTVAQLKILRKKLSGHIKPLPDIVEAARRTKDNSEVMAITKAGKIAAKALDHALKKMKPGITETELAGIIELEMRKLGAKVSFDTIVAFGANASEPHHNSGKTKLKKNDTVLIDFGAKLAGYCSDMTRCFTVGKTSRLYNKAYEAVRQAQIAAIEKIKPGVMLKTIDKTTRDVIREHGFEPHGHGTGHGLGLEVHESPPVSPKSKGKLQAGDVITIEPGIYIPGKFGIRIEDDVLVTKTSYKILTK